jgi:hypothetical protein
MDFNANLRSDMIQTMVEDDNDGGGLTFNEFSEKYNHRAGGGGREITSSRDATDLAHDLGLHGNERAQFVDLVTSGLSAKEVFSHFDLNGSGRISVNDLKRSQNEANDHPDNDASDNDAPDNDAPDNDSPDNGGGGENPNVKTNYYSDKHFGGGSEKVTLEGGSEGTTYLISVQASDGDTAYIKGNGINEGENYETKGPSDISGAAAVLYVPPGESVSITVGGSKGSYVIQGLEGQYEVNGSDSSKDEWGGLNSGDGDLYFTAMTYDDPVEDSSINTAKKHGYTGGNFGGDANFVGIDKNGNLDEYGDRDGTWESTEGGGDQNRTHIQFSLDRV